MFPVHSAALKDSYCEQLWTASDKVKKWTGLVRVQNVILTSFALLPWVISEVNVLFGKPWNYSVIFGVYTGFKQISSQRSYPNPNAKVKI